MKRTVIPFEYFHFYTKLINNNERKSLGHFFKSQSCSGKRSVWQWHTFGTCLRIWRGGICCEQQHWMNARLADHRFPHYYLQQWRYVLAFVDGRCKKIMLVYESHKTKPFRSFKNRWKVLSLYIERFQNTTTSSIESLEYLVGVSHNLHTFVNKQFLLLNYFWQ